MVKYKIWLQIPIIDVLHYQLSLLVLKTHIGQSLATHLYHLLLLPVQGGCLFASGDSIWTIGGTTLQVVICNHILMMMMIKRCW